MDLFYTPCGIPGPSAGTIKPPPFRYAFEKAMLADMTVDELKLYDKAGIAITDACGRVELARKETWQEGRQEGWQEGR